MDSKKDKFKLIKKMIESPRGKARAELNASKNPMKFLKENKNPNIKGLKGIAL